jgi:putative spermidine/putrescine transport system ATP-binding protein
MREGLLQLNDVSKAFDTIAAVERISFALAEGEFLSLLGPSGSGKTTTLQMIAGLTHPSSGEILLAGRPIGPLPPYKRDIGMVFQNYALFPHLTVARNIAFPLEMRRMRRAEIARRVAAVLKLVDLPGFEARHPQQLSGGQQQRVALARAIVFEPKLLLMDEPLGALDKKLREQMQLEIKHLHKRLGVSIIYVTHDQDEALVMSDRIGVFNQGRLEQIGTVEELYEQPTTRFVAEFVGETNVIRGAVRDGANGSCSLDTAEGPLRGRARQAFRTGSAALISVRPERLRLEAGDAARSDRDGIQGHICEVIYMGRLRKYVLDTAGGQKLIVARPIGGVEARSFAVGDAVVATFQPADAVVLQDTHEQGGN